MEYVPCEPSETYTLPYPDKGWRGVPMASISIGRSHLNRWVFSMSITSADHMSGSSFGLGDYANKTDHFETRSDAMNAAIAFVRKRVEGQKGYESHQRWIAGLAQGQQADLFG